MMQLYKRSHRFVRLVIAITHCVLLTSQILVSAEVLRFINDTTPIIASKSFRIGLLSNDEETDLKRTPNEHEHQLWERSRTSAIERQPHNFTVPSDLGEVRLLEDRRRKLPDAIIIGVKKGGTRALIEFLKVHPDVRAPGPEIHFFDRQYHKGLDWYRSRMPATLDGQLTIEKTPSYFVTKSVPQRIYAMSPDVKLVLVVRDPVTRALSDYTQVRLKRPDLPSFETMAFGNATAPSDRHRRRQRTEDDAVNISWGAIRIGLYSRYLDRWLRRFSLDRFHFVSGERLVVDPAGELRRLQDFLGVKRLVTDKHFYYNATKGFPCLKKAETGGAPRCLGQSKGRTHPVIEDAVLRRLRDFYRPHNRRFYDLTGIDFGWN